MAKTHLSAVRIAISLAALLAFSGAHAAARLGPWKFFQEANGMSVYLGPSVKRIARQYVLVVFKTPQPMSPYATTAPDQLYLSEVIWLQIECPPPGVAAPASVLDIMKYFYPVADPSKISLDGSGSNGLLGLPNGPTAQPAPQGTIKAYIAALDCRQWLAPIK